MMKFFKCSSDQIVIPITFCYTDAEALKNAIEISPNTVEAAEEKHMPIITCKGDTVIVNVGSIAHPMLEEHSIMTVVLETKKGAQYQFLQHDSEPVAKFRIADGDQAVAAYAYCNLHGLWKADMD